MSAYAVYTAHPPEFSLRLTLTGLARLDRRYADLERLRRRADLGAVVQDSADLLHAHLRLHLDGQEWSGTPGLLDEDGSGRPCSGHGCSEAELAARLGLKAPGGRLPPGELAARLPEWPHGLVHLFGPLGLQRRLNLAGLTDRLELDFALEAGGTDTLVLWARRLEAGGGLVSLRAGPDG